MVLPHLLSAGSRKGLSLLSGLIFPLQSLPWCKNGECPTRSATSGSDRKGETSIKQCSIGAECCSQTLAGSVQRFRLSLVLFHHIQLQINRGNERKPPRTESQEPCVQLCLPHAPLRKWTHSLCYRFNKN